MGIAIRSRITRSVLVLAAIIAVAINYSPPTSAVSAGLNNTSPMPTNSAPSGMFHHRIRFNELGHHNDVQLDVYMDANQQKVISIDRFECFKRFNGNVNANTPILRIIMEGATTTQQTITASNLCSNSGSDLFRNFTLPFPKSNPNLSGKYFVSVTIEYITPLAYLDGTVAGPTQRNAIGFTARVVGDNTALLAPVSGGGRNYSLLANQSGGNSSFRIPFATTCGVAADGSRRPVKIYDADVTSTFGQLEVEIFKKGTNEAVQLFRNGETIGSLVNNDTKFIAGPGAGNRENTGFDFVPVTGQKYVLKISQLYNGNAVDIGLPGGMDTIYGAIKCTKPGEDLPIQASVSIAPVAAISQSDIEPGEPTSAIAYASVNDFPDLYAQEWPYNEVAMQRAVNTGQTATRVTYNTQQGEEAVNVEADKQIQCADGVYRAPVNCADLGRFQCNDNVDRDSCGTYNWRCNRKVSAGGGTINYNSSASTRIPGNAPANCQTNNDDHFIQCADGNYRAPSNCDDLGTFRCNDNVGRDSCGEYNWFCSWNSDSRYVNYNANTQAGMNGCKIYKYYCKDTNGNYISSGENWQYRTFNNLVRAECNNQWDCPSPSPVRGFGSDDSSANCKIFRCFISTDVSYGTWYEPDGIGQAHLRCDFRCSDGAGSWGAGDHAILSSAGAQGKWDAGDMNCYYQPSFTIGCYISDGVTTTTVYDTVTGNGNWCVRNITVQGSPTIGGIVCSTTTVFTPPNGAAWPGPGKALTQSWSFSVAGPDSDCVRVVSKPTFKVFGGDVSAGSTFASTTCTNDFSNSSIVGWSGSATGFNGSHTEFGALASGSVFGFASSKKQGNVPSGLTFANTSVSGERFGGDFGPMPCITNHASLKPADAQVMSSLEANRPSGSYEYNSSNINTSPTIGKGKQFIIYRTGDLNIDSNIRYERSGWATLDDIPALKVVVKGDIFIGPGVAELNGVYVAQPRDDGSGGRIFTCAGVANSDTFTNCSQTLTVNGAFIAKRVVLGRSFGTQIQGTTAEIFRYLPELWLTKWPQAGSSNSIRYDSMTNLAPIL